MSVGAVSGVNPGVIVAALGLAGAFVAWSWKSIGRPMFDLVWPGKRIKALEDSRATSAEVATLGDELRRLHKEHVEADAEAFRAVHEEVGRVRDAMAKASDLSRVESKLDALLVDGFGGGRRRT